MPRGFLVRLKDFGIAQFYIQGLQRQMVVAAIDHPSERIRHVTDDFCDCKNLQNPDRHPSIAKYGNSYENTWLLFEQCECRRWLDATSPKLKSAQGYLYTTVDKFADPLDFVIAQFCSGPSQMFGNPRDRLLRPTNNQQRNIWLRCPGQQIALSLGKDVWPILMI
ncbi:hypothetical protein [Ruegeria arenilitoris]|uniref:hypothetical protein n=1 Tax=Ruegeria arenilitoris TaxID=1173585 RepID=UPI00147B6E7A|nr:hypothetical protein [Ruegeria arenilitoris]